MYDGEGAELDEGTPYSRVGEVLVLRCEVLGGEQEDSWWGNICGVGEIANLQYTYLWYFYHDSLHFISCGIQHDFTQNRKGLSYIVWSGFLSSLSYVIHI